MCDCYRWGVGDNLKYLDTKLVGRLHGDFEDSFPKFSDSLKTAFMSTLDLFVLLKPVVSCPVRSSEYDR